MDDDDQTVLYFMLLYFVGTIQVNSRLIAGNGKQKRKKEIQKYDLDEMLEKKLYAYLPFYFMRYEKFFPRWELEEVPQDLQDEIYAEKNLEELSRMLKLAAKVKSIEEFLIKK